MRMNFGAVTTCILILSFGSNVHAQSGCPDPIPAKPTGAQLSACLNELQSGLKQLQASKERGAINNIVYLGEIRSCREKVIPVPNIENTTTDDWFVISSPVKLTAQFGTGVMTNNALYSISLDIDQNADKNSWRAYLYLQVNAATEQKREPTDYCKGPENRDNSIVDLYAIRKR